MLQNMSWNVLIICDGACWRQSWKYSQSTHSYHSTVESPPWRKRRTESRTSTTTTRETPWPPSGPSTRWLPRGSSGKTQAVMTVTDSEWSSLRQTSQKRVVRSQWHQLMMREDLHWWVFLHISFYTCWAVTSWNFHSIFDSYQSVNTPV